MKLCWTASRVLLTRVPGRSCLSRKSVLYFLYVNTDINGKRVNENSRKWSTKYPGTNIHSSFPNHGMISSVPWSTFFFFFQNAWHDFTNLYSLVVAFSALYQSQVSTFMKHFSHRCSTFSSLPHVYTRRSCTWYVLRVLLGRKMFFLLLILKFFSSLCRNSLPEQ